MSNVNDKLKNIVISDRAGMIENILRLVKSDVYAILSNYMEVKRESIMLNADLDENGDCVITLSAATNAFYEVGKIL